jgi:type III secretion system YscI/HrpB-like protein
MGRSSQDASMLMSMQMEVVNYTLMVDVTSKLTGKSTQSFDTLMKGQ